MGKTDTIYVKLVVSYGKPTELDNVGCDGLYIQSTEICTKEIVALKRMKDVARRVADDESEGMIHFAIIGELRDTLTAEEQEDEHH